MGDPLIVKVLRGDVVESRHRIHAVIANADGEIQNSWGEADLTVIPRSGVKPIQALPLLETGAASHYGLGSEEIALACGSHGATPVQVRIVQDWLERLGLDEDALSCGPQRPMDEKSGDAILRDGGTFRPVHNNSSGQHAGFLTVARFLDLPIAGYAEVDHPVQDLVFRAIKDFTEVEVRPDNTVKDGCGMPTIAMPLRSLAMAAARLVDPQRFSGKRIAAIGEMQKSLAAAPEMVASPGRFDTAVMTTVGHTGLAKSGAEGVFMMGFTDSGLGMSLKAEDGAKRAADVAAAYLFKHVRQTCKEGCGPIDHFAPMPLVNTQGVIIGKVEMGA